MCLACLARLARCLARLAASHFVRTAELEETTKIKTDCIIIIVTLINLPKRSWTAVANLSFFPIVDNPRLSIDASDKMRSDCSVRPPISSSSNFLAMLSSLNSAFAQTLTR